MILPPDDYETEEAVLGAVLVSDPAVDRVVEVGLKAEDFYSAMNRAVFAAVLRLRDRGDAVDQLTVKAELQRAGDLEAAGGADRLAVMAGTVAAPGNARIHAERVRELARLRHLRTLVDETRDRLDEGAVNGQVKVLADALIDLDLQDDEAPGLLDLDGLRKLAPPAWLIRDHLVERGLNLLYGTPGAGKTFVALDWSLSIATGEPWLGNPVKIGTVVYVAAEGAHGLRNRIETWMTFHRIESLDRFHVWPGPVNLYRRETAVLESEIRRLPEPPVLVVFDTVARSMAGGDENATPDMTVVVDEVARLQRKYGLAVLLVHHPRKGTEEPRGNTALAGAVDLSRFVKVDGKVRKITAKKTKDWVDPDPIAFALESLDRSAVIRPRTVGEASGRLERESEVLLATIRKTFRTEWTPTAEIRKASDLGRTTFYEVLKRLTDEERLEDRMAGAQRKEYRLKESPPAVRSHPKPSERTGTDRPSVPGSLKEPDGGQDTDPEGSDD